MDLVSFNMQRGRELGIPSYMEFRKLCGLPVAHTFDELFGLMPNETVLRYISIFRLIFCFSFFIINFLESNDNFI